MPRVVVAGALSLIIVSLVAWLMLGPSTNEPLIRVETEAGKVLPEDGESADGEPAAVSLARPASGDVDGVEPTVGLLDGPTLSGTVRDRDGPALAEASVFLVRYTPRRERNFAARRLQLRASILGDAKTQKEAPPVAYQTTTDKGGHYTILLSSISAGEYQVVARQDGYASARQRWTRTEESSVVDLLLPLGEVITGVVLDRRGEPVVGAVVEAGRRGRGPPWARSASLADRSESDAHGLFSLSVPPGTYGVKAQASGYTPASISDVAPGTEDVVLELAPAVLVDGRVLSENSEPIVDAQVSVYLGRWAGGVNRRNFRERRPVSGEVEGTGVWRWWVQPLDRVTTDAEGAFQLTDVPRERFYVVAEKPGFVAAQWGSEPSEEDEEDSSTTQRPLAKSIDFQLARAGLLNGLVSDSSGKPIAEAFVSIAPSSEADFMPFGRRDRGSDSSSEEKPAEPVSMFSVAAGVTTSVDGRFSFDTLAPGNYSLSIESNRHPVRRVDDVDLQEEGTDVDVVLDDGIELKGRVLSRATSEPLANTRLSLRVTNRERRHTETDAAGLYSIGGLTRGSIEEIQIVATGYSLGIFENVELDGESSEQELDFELEPAANLKGRVVDSRGEAVPNVRVSVMPVLDRGLENERGARRLMRRMFAQGDRTRTGADGVFAFGELSGGISFRVTAEHPDFKPLEDTEVSIEPGENFDDIELVLERGGRISVVVQRPDGTMTAGAEVYLEQVQVEAKDDESGQAEEGRRERGRRRGGFRRFLDRMTRGGAREQERRRSRTGPDGHAVFAGLDQGSYGLRVQAEGFRPFYLRAQVGFEADLTLAADLLPENVITGFVHDVLGVPVADAQVRAERRVFLPGDEPEEGERRRRYPERSETRSDADGRFRVGSLGEGAYAVRVRADGFADARLEEVDVNTDVVVAIEGRGALNGFVVTQETGVPIESFRARLVPSETAADDGAAPILGGRESRRLRRWSNFDDVDGRFEFTDLPPGRYSLEVVAPGHTGASTKVEIVDGETTEGITVALLAGLSMHGQLAVFGTGETISNVEIYLVPLTPSETNVEREDVTSRRRRPDGPRRAGQGRRGRQSRISREDKARRAVKALSDIRRTYSPALSTDDDGLFKFTNLDAGEYLVIFEHDDFLPSQEKVRVDDSRVIRELAIQLSPGEKLTGEVRLSDGNAAIGISVVLRSADGLVRRGETDGLGQYEVTGLLPGSYRVDFRERAREVAESQNIEIDSGINQFNYP